MADFECTLNLEAKEFPHFWEHTVGSGHALLALRADYQQQLKLAHQELGFSHVSLSVANQFSVKQDQKMGDVLQYQFYLKALPGYSRSYRAVSLWTEMRRYWTKALGVSPDAVRRFLKK
jgi:hypothetical protein